MVRIPAVEGEEIQGLSLSDEQRVRARLVELQQELRSRVPFLGRSAGVTALNIVGTVSVDADLLIDIAPKTQPDQDWAGAIVDLLAPATQVVYGGETTNAELRAIRTLPDAFGDLYADQLERALRREGPMTMIEPQYLASPVLAGRLDVTEWVRNRQLQPARFPQHRFGLTADNVFTSALAWVANVLATRSSSPRTRARLASLSGALRPGSAPHVLVDPGISYRDLPPQWRSYAPAWTTARAVLRRVAPLHRDGSFAGFGLAVEAWPLLETLLERSVKAAARRATDAGFRFVAGSGHSGDYPIRTPIGDTSAGTEAFHVPGSVNPDAVLKLDGEVLVTFEAKYSLPSPSKLREHAFQALSTAAALEAPLVVLAYPSKFDAVQWAVHGFRGTPRRLVAIGLDLYGYRAGTGDDTRGTALFRAVEDDLVRQQAARSNRTA